MQYRDNELLRGYVQELSTDVKERYRIDPNEFKSYNIKRGLRNSDGTGVLAGATAVGSVRGYNMVDGEPVPEEGKLYYRGIEIMEIIDQHMKEGTFGFEEVAYLLLLGVLPTESQLRHFDTVLSAARTLPENFTEDMIIKAPSPNIMNKLSRAVLALYSYDPNPDDTSVENLVRQSIELIGRMQVIVANAYAVKRHYYDGESLFIHVPREELSMAENFLHIFRRDNLYTEAEAHLLDLMMILHAEHGGGNNSTFTCRVLSSSGTDTYGAISGAVNSLKGPLHGGANAKVMEMFANIKANVPDVEDEDLLYQYLLDILSGKANDFSGKIYGLGHAVYTISDPRAVLLKRYAHDMARDKGFMKEFELMENIERLGLRALQEKLGDRKTVCANVDMYSGLVYRMLDIPEELYTPLFAIARTAGWCAHRIEEVVSGGRIIRPAYRSASKKSGYVPMNERE